MCEHPLTAIDVGRDSQTVLVGDAAGGVSLVDFRMPSKPVWRSQCCHPSVPVRAVHVAHPVRTDLTRHHQ